MKKFKQLAEHISGVQPGFYLLGAETNVGKTAVLSNLCLDILETYICFLPGQSFQTHRRRLL